MPSQRHQDQPRRHHYVPQFLLRRFAENPREGGSIVYQLDYVASVFAAAGTRPAPAMKGAP
jgi:hypothetical protein